MKRFTTILVFISWYISWGQEVSYSFGARNAGIATSSVSISDEYSLFNNVAGISLVDRPVVFAGYQNRYNLSAFQTIGGGLVYPLSFGSAGLSYYKFGDDLFSQQKAQFAFAHKLQNVSLGIGIDFLQFNIATLGTQHAVSIQFGGIAKITPELWMGAHVFNLNQATLHKETNEKIPTVMKAGLSYRPTDELMLNGEVEKDLGFDEVVKFGIEYRIVEKVFLRTGIRTDPFVNTFGVGFHPKSLKVDYAYSRNTDLGSIHEVSLSYYIGHEN